MIPLETLNMGLGYYSDIEKKVGCTFSAGRPFVDTGDSGGSYGGTLSRALPRGMIPLGSLNMGLDCYSETEKKVGCTFSAGRPFVSTGYEQDTAGALPPRPCKGK